MRIGILGGTFDPIHKGHMEMADIAKKELSLDEVWIMPAGSPPHKDGAAVTSRMHRFEMCEYACKYHPNVLTMYGEFSNLKSEPNYTYLTLEKLKKDYPEDEFYFIMGQDSIDYFDKWREPQRILNAASIVVFLRGEDGEEEETRRCREKVDSLNSLFEGTII
nr:nicotinate (nicotinamide) nucleotide adenylyltransferase [Lachnospiraceae bacterium]